MIKNQTFYTKIYSYNSEREPLEYDKKIQKFIDSLDEEGHTFLSINTISFGVDRPNGIRTQITYRENEKRNVITEKNR